ncbi:MAG: hypothetical protein SZ59_C0002G0359 [candidate division TM6 bacterium GW2011_GWF2_28_16]|nr:MAG: hypothetical protein SZ59_C0002G0359 [candidate division TM6 bacterium GW2011_GWF2_28_16]
MKNLKNKFERVSQKFVNKKEYYKKIIDKWRLKNDLSMYNSANSLYEKTEALFKEITENFTATVEGQLKPEYINKKIKEFKRVSKKLNDITKPVWQQWIEAIVFAGSLVFVLRTYVFGLYHVPTGSAEPTILVGDRIWGNKTVYFFNKIKHGDSVIFDNPRFIYDKSSKINYFWQKYIGLPVPLLGLSAGPDNWVKRVIAIPGDTIEGRVENNRTVIYRNGVKLDETAYVNKYPLICLRKTTGFLPFNSIGMINIPGFLVSVKKLGFYTYDPEKSYDNQPFYSMKESEIKKDLYGLPILREAYSPSYIYDYETGDIERSVDNFGPIRIPEGKYWVMGDSRKNSEDSRFWSLLDEHLIHGRASFVIYSVDSEEALWIFELIKHPIDFWFKNIRYNRFLKWIK